ncbi:TolC family protein [Ahrensia sp. R2A130]|uniref:TolC family protein n=1 Tax=Ahrensia sp. R2A130 TaxID=744979 RepID=UPI0001E0E903|nr:TolC family protein [Ahrensia sp. R2A130]EFL87466.1 putative TolC family type I secretion outer membrane protein [Ahrensia sp. R2A130]
MAHKTRRLIQPISTVLLAGFLVGLAGAGTASAESLATTARDAVSYHPDVKVLQANRAAIGEELVAARGLALPGVRLEGRTGGIVDRTGRQGYSEASVKLRQPLYDGGKYRSETARQTARVGSADGRVEDTINTVALNAVQAYLEVVRSRRVAQRAHRNRKAIAHIVSRVRSRVRGGAGNQADLEQARARLYAADNSVATAEIQVSDALDLFRTAVGREPGKLRQDDLPTSKLPRKLHGVLSSARDASPKLIAIRYDAEAAAAAVGTAKSVLLPQVALELSANYKDDITRLTNKSKGQDSLKAMVVLSMSLYNGGIDRARIREARHRAVEAEQQVGSARVSIERELRLAWNAWKGSTRKVGHLTKQSKANRRLVRLRLNQYDSGLATLISILDAQNEAFVSGVQATNEFNAGRFAFYKLLAATGGLARTFNIES